MFNALRRWWNKPGDEVADALDAAFESGRRIEREECALLCEDLWSEEADAAANGTDAPKYHDAIECAAAIRARANVAIKPPVLRSA